MRLDFLTGKYGMQLFFLLFMAIVSMLIFQLLSIGLILVATPFELSDFLQTDYVSIFTASQEGYWAFFILLFTQSVGVFVVPSLLFRWIAKHSELPLFTFNFRTSLHFIWLLPLFALSGLFIVGFLGELNMMLDLPDMFHEMEETATKTVEYLLSFDSTPYILLNILLVCVLPAIGEELFFRGIIQKILIKWTKENWVGIFITAAIFSAIHFQFLTFLPRFFMGIMLGYLFVWSRNLLIPIIAHFLHNLMSILFAYATSGNEIAEREIGTNYFILIISIAVMSGIGFYYYTLSKKRDVSLH